MGIKKGLLRLAQFADNPVEAGYRPEKEMKILYAVLLILLPIFLGFCCEFYILISGPLFIYWIIAYLKGREYWKELGWKMRWYYLPTVLMAILGLYFAFDHTLVRLGGSFFRLLGFK